ncbi:MAG: DUF2817 domain-containing protein [Planctomycetota bacterium]
MTTLLGACSTFPVLPLVEREEAPVPVDLLLGYSVEKRPLRVRILAQGEKSVLVLGAMHGDEEGSRQLVEDWARELLARPDALEGLGLALVSVVNPDGLSRGQRGNARGVDLNRNFPADNFRPARSRGYRPFSEPESRFVRRTLELVRPVLVIAVHQPRRSVNYDGPARGIAEAMASCNGYRLEQDVGYPTPGSLGSWLGKDLGIPIVTLELPPRPAQGRSFFSENRTALEKALGLARGMPPRDPAGSAGGEFSPTMGVSPTRQARRFVR